MKDIDFEMIMVLIGISFIIAIGIVAFVALIAGISVAQIGILYTWGIVFGLAGVTFGILIFSAKC